jgi:hypothetical protein
MTTDVITLANIAALRAYTGTEPVIWVEGYTSTADGGEGMFAYVAGTATDNGGTVIVATGPGSPPTHRVYVREYNHQPLNICWFGAPLNSTSDSTAALNNALAALPAAGGTIYFPAGQFTFASEISYSISAAQSPFSLCFVGDGADASILYWPSTNGILITAQLATHSVHFRDMTIATGQSCKYTGVQINQTDYAYPVLASDFFRMTFRGLSTLAEYWAAGLVINGLENVNYDTLLFFGGSGSGAGLSIEDTFTSGSPPTNNFTVVHNLSKCTFYNGQVGLVYGQYVQGVAVSQCNFTNVVIGIQVPSGATGGFQLAVVGSQFGCSQYGIDIEGNMAALSVSSSLFLTNSTSTTNNPGIYINHYLNTASIIDNQFLGASSEPPYGTGIEVTSAEPGSNGFYGVVSGNCFQSLAVGVDLTGAYKWNVLGNIYEPTVTTPVIPGPAGFNSVGVATD